MAADYTTIHPFFRTGRKESQFKAFKRATNETLEDVRQKANEWLQANKDHIDVIGTGWTYQGSTDPEKKGPSSYDHVLTITYIDKDEAEGDGNGESEDGEDDPDDPDQPEEPEPEEPKPGDKTEDSKVEVDGYYYDTFTEALQNATAGQTVTLVENAEQTENMYLKEGITLDLADKTLTLTDGHFLCISGGSKSTIKGGTVTQNPSSNSNYAAIQVGSKSQGSGTLTLEDVKVTGKIGLVPVGTGSVLNINKGTDINCTGFGISTNGLDSGAVVNFNGGRVIANNEGAAVYMPSGEFNMTSGRLEGGAGILARGGKVKITGGIIKSNSTSEIQLGDTSYKTKAAPVCIDKNNKYNNGKVDVYIDGGVIIAPSKDDYAVIYTEDGQLTEKKSESEVDGFEVWGGFIQGKVLESAHIDADWDEKYPNFKIEDCLDSNVTEIPGAASADNVI